jgi:hypothetical protein
LFELPLHLLSPVDCRLLATRPSAEAAPKVEKFDEPEEIANLRAGLETDKRGLDMRIRSRTEKLSSCLSMTRDVGQQPNLRPTTPTDPNPPTDT